MLFRSSAPLINSPVLALAAALVVAAAPALLTFATSVAAQDASGSAPRATISTEPLSERRVHYDLTATLDAETKTIDGTARIVWRNPDRVPVDELQFHLYLNAFEGPETTFMRESGGAHRGFQASSADPWGGMDITAMSLFRGDTPGRDILSTLEFIRPDDGNPNDHTVARVLLPEPIAPGDSAVVELRFTSRLPEIVARTGWLPGPSGRPFFMVAQWFPKLGVYEIPGQRYVPEGAERGAWSTHQFHANSEFYADFGTYDVQLTVPADHVVGATGVLVSGNAAESASEPADAALPAANRTLRYRAEDVHDFAWTASPDFLVHEDTWRHVAIRLLLMPTHASQAERHLEATRISLEGLDERLGTYPYTTLTVVDGLGGANGMEYPTLITAGTFYGLPSWFRPLELVIVHEFGHQYFQGMLASNEAEEAWLDEGMNSYIETKVMDAAWPGGSVLDVAGIRISGRDFHRISYTKNDPSRGALQTKSWEYAFGDFGKASYSKPATVMHSLEGYLGEERMDRFLKTYVAEWRFRHPTTRDLQDVAEHVAGENLDWFFDQYVYGTAVLDYRIDGFSSRREADSMYVATVRVHRVHDGTFPVPVRVRFADGSTRERVWRGETAWANLTFRGPTPAVEAFIDPDDTAPLDINRLNNRRVSASERSNLFARRAQLRLTAFLQRLMYLIP